MIIFNDHSNLCNLVIGIDSLNPREVLKATIRISSGIGYTFHIVNMPSHPIATFCTRCALSFYYLFHSSRCTMATHPLVWNFIIFLDDLSSPRYQWRWWSGENFCLTLLQHLAQQYKLLSPLLSFIYNNQQSRPPHSLVITSITQQSNSQSRRQWLHIICSVVSYFKLTS